MALANVSVVASTTGTLALQRASVPPAGQVLPGVVEVTVFSRVRSPVAGLLTVTV